MTLCEGGCGYHARECCKSVLMQPHQSVCPIWGEPFEVIVDEGQRHMVRFRLRPDGSRGLVCEVPSCDLSNVVSYRRIS